MTIDFETVITTYASPGNTITTKMVWSFTDTIQDAIHYSHGIILVANPPPNALIWEQAMSHPYRINVRKSSIYFLGGQNFKCYQRKERQRREIIMSCSIYNHYPPNVSTRNIRD